MKAADELRGPFIQIEHAGVVCEQTKLSSLKSVCPANAVEVVTEVVAAKGMAIRAPLKSVCTSPV